MADHIRPFVQQTLPLNPIVMSQTRRQVVLDEDLRTPKVEATLRKWATDYEDEGETCSICFESFKKIKVDAEGNGPCSDPLEFNGGHEGSIVVTPCNHKFGYTCLGNWLAEKDNCPMCRNIILPLDPPKLTHHAQQRQRSYSIESQSTPADMQLMASTHPIARSVSLNSTTPTTPFELQRWHARFGTRSDHLDGARNSVAGETTQVNIPSPPVRLGTTTHGHPATPTSTSVEPEFVRRTYQANITTYDLTRRPRNPPTSQTRPSIDSPWRNWNYTSRYNLRNQRRIANSVAAAVGVSAGLGSVIAMPRAERIAPTGRDDNSSSSSRNESDNDHSIMRALGHSMGLGTVIGMPRAEWRSSMRPLSPLGDSRRPSLARSESANNSSSETLIAARSRETSMDEDLRRLPGLASSMWARTWG
ncbi:hypothetical protein EAE96_000618 [Botrytis aclada]|nr:hypothetical protein EAE96_000618 [Botrytis aclada]